MIEIDDRPLYKQPWTNRFAAQVLTHLWWRVEKQFDSLSDYELQEAKQLYYRLSYLNVDELELLRDKYFRPENHPLGDQHLTNKYHKTTDEIRQWRLTILRKLSAYQDKPKGE